MNRPNRTLHVEVVQKPPSSANKDEIKELVHLFINNFANVTPGLKISEIELEEQPSLQEHVECIHFCDLESKEDVVPADVEFLYHVYKLDEFGAEKETTGNSGEELAVADVWALPAREFHGLWENLVYDSDLKRDTVRFVECALKLAEHGVDPHVVSCNRVVLLHGPPGTGKTSLCRALAQKLAVRFGDRFPRARLVEIYGDGLFSKWFSESGKTITRLFERVHEIAAERRQLVCVLIDEVESLAHARSAALAGREPSDSIRAVNALLTQLDRLRGRPNVLVLTTSNVTGAIDVAFADRADIKRRVGPPSARAAYEILRGCCRELAERGLVASRERVYEVRVLEGVGFAESEPLVASLRLWEVACSAAAERVGGRALRRLPFLALSLHAPGAAPSMSTLVAALGAALRDHLNDAEVFRG